MIKKVIFLILSLLLFVTFITYGDFFEFKLNEIQFDTLKKSLIIYATLALLCFIIGELSKNYSQVDKELAEEENEKMSKLFTSI